MDCLRFREKRINSQRKFLSIFAKTNLFKSSILEPKGFKIQFFESLILAQDERWRRALHMQGERGNDFGYYLVANG